MSYWMIDGWKIKAEDELVLGGFVAKKDSMRKFEPPYEGVILTDAVKITYINKAIKKTANSHLVIQFI